MAGWGRMGGGRKLEEDSARAAHDEGLHVVAIVVEKVERYSEHEMEDSTQELLAFPGPALRPSALFRSPLTFQSSLPPEITSPTVASSCPL